MLSKEDKHQIHNFRLALKNNSGTLSKKSCYFLIDLIKKLEDQIRTCNALNLNLEDENRDLKQRLKKNRDLIVKQMDEILGLG